MSVSREEMIAEARRRGLIPAETPAPAPAAAPEAAPAPAVPRAGALPGKPTEEAAAIDRMIRGGLKTAAGEFVANMIGLPHAAGELLALGAAGAQTAVGAAADAVRRKPINLGERFAAAREEQAASFPANALLAMPEPTGDDVLQAVGMQPAEGIAADAGRTVGDVATLMTLRPGARVREILASRRATPAADRRAALLAREGGVPPKVAEEADEAASLLMRGTGRATEAGFEGAVMAALGEGDPAATAAWSAGIQAGGSAALATKGWIFRNPGKAALSLWLGHEMWRAVMPGSQDALGSKDQTIREMVGAYGLGVVASLAGAGRPTGAVARQLSNAARPAVASVITQLQEAERRGEPHYEQVISRFSQDPNYFGREARNRLELAANRERPNALLDEIDDLMRSRRFRERLETTDKHTTGGAF